jgi:hypothetical protein
MKPFLSRDTLSSAIRFPRSSPEAAPFHFGKHAINPLKLRLIYDCFNLNTASSDKLIFETNNK